MRFEGIRRWLQVGVLAWVLLGLGAGPRTHAAPIPADQRYSLRDVQTNQKALALTFDISWGTRMPIKVVHLLENDHVAATFFLSGPWVKQNPELVKQMAKDGFEIESHGWAHVNYSGLSPSGVVDNIAKADQAIFEVIGKHPTFVRPPNGDFNVPSIRAARSIGYTTVTWDTDSLDWMNPGVGRITARVLKRAHPGDIVLLHASDTCKETDLALPTIIQGLRRDGYQLVTMDQLLRMGKPVFRD